MTAQMSKGGDKKSQGVLEKWKIVVFKTPPVGTNIWVDERGATKYCKGTLPVFYLQIKHCVSSI